MSTKGTCSETPRTDAVKRTFRTNQFKGCAWDAAINLAETLERELAEERRKLDTILYDVDYKGGLQDWQQKHRDALMAAMEAAELAIKYATQNHALLAALKEASSLLCFLHGAFGDQLKDKDKARMTAAHVANRAALAAAEPKAEGKG